MTRTHARNIIKAVITSLFISFSGTSAATPPLPVPLFTPEHAGALLPLVGYLVSPSCYSCWETIINTMQLTSATLLTVDGTRIASQVALNRTVTEPEQKAGTAMASVAIAEVAIIQEVLAAQGFKRWSRQAELTPGARYYHAITSMGSGIGLWVICAGVSMGDFWTTVTGNIVVVVFFLTEAVTTRWRDPQLGWIGKWQIITGNIGGMLFAASSFVTYASQQAADAVLAAALLVISAALYPSAVVYFYQHARQLIQRHR